MRLVGLLMAIIAAACTTDSTDPTTATSGDATTTTIGTTTTALPPPTVDVGVDLEASIIRLALVGPIPDDLWTGHFAYWNSVNSDLGGVGGRLTVELVRVASADEARELGALAVSIDESEDDAPRDMLAMRRRTVMLPGGYIADLTRATTDESLTAARRSITDGAVPFDRAGYGAELLIADTGCTEFGDTLDIDRVAPGEISPAETAAIVYVCVDHDASASVAAAALSARPGSLLVFASGSWRPGLATLLDGADVLIAGYVSGPAVDGAPAGDIMGLVLGSGPWSSDLIDGYTTALSMHAVLEAALDTGDLTQASVRAAVDTLADAAFGFGTEIHLGRLDVGEPTGVGVITSSG